MTTLVALSVANNPVEEVSERLMVPVNPLNEVKLRVEFPVPPAMMLTFVVLVVMLKSWEV